MRLAVCEPNDEAGLWAVAGLRRLGVPVEVVLPDELVTGVTLVHRVGRAGATVELRTAAGLEFRTGEVEGVLNRLLDVPDAPLARVGPADREYVAEELGATLASWLASLPCPVLNRPTPVGLGGPWRAPAQWRWLAAQVGVAALPWRLACWDEPEPAAPEEYRTVLAIGDEVAGPVPEGMAPGCLALARAAGAGLLGLDLARASDGAWRLDTATPLPDLRHGGRPGLEALRRALGAG